MREIKFRAWCYVENKMILPSDVEEHSLENITRDFEWDVQQYIGIKDKNDKEIYEGDILRCYSNFNEYVSIAPVVFSKYGYGFVMDSSGRHNIDSDDYIPIQNNWALEGDMVYKIIGNIHENSELLK